MMELVKDATRTQTKMTYNKDNKLTKLPPNAEELFDAQVKKWTAIGLKTGPMDREKAKEAMRLVYENPINPVKWHGNVIFCDSPMSLVLADSVLRNAGASVRPSVGASVRASVWDSVWASVGASVRDSVGASVRASVGASVRPSVGASVWDSVWASVRDSVRASVRDSVWDSVWASAENFKECSRLSYYDTLRMLGVDVIGAGGLAQITAEAGWWIARENVALIADNPKWIDLDEFGRLHSETRKAIEYPDGWGVYSIGGVVVPEQVVLSPESLKPEEISNEPNAEVRRIMIERFGPDRYFEATGATVVSGDFVEVTRGGRKMPRFLLADNSGDKWLIGTDGSTRRTYTMPVPRAVTTCREAHEAICGLDERKCVGQS